MPSDRGEMVAEGRTTVNPPNDIVKQKKICLRIPMRPASRIDYPKTIDVESPDSFKDDHDNQTRKCHERKRRRIWHREVVAPLPTRWNPNLLVLREHAPLSSHTISLRFRKAPPSLFRLPTELRLQILRYLLKSSTVITNPHTYGSSAAQDKLIPNFHTFILRACRQVYLEGSAILYQENTFRFTNWFSWFTFQTSEFSVHQDGIRHLELHTTVAERYLNRVVRAQGQLFYEWRIRGATHWDWPFSPPCRLPNLRTLKLELKDFHRLPEVPPANTPYFRPDPMTRQGRDQLLTKIYLIRHILSSCRAPKLQDVTIVGVSNPRYVLMLESHFLTKTCFDVERSYKCSERMVRYLENRTGGRWETQVQRARHYWDLIHVCRAKRLRQGWQSESLSRDYCLPGLDAWHLALLMWIRTRAAKHGRNDPPAHKPPSILWTW